MGKVVSLVFLMVSIIFQKGNNSTLTGKWRLIKYYDLVARTSESEPANTSRSIVINFSDNGAEGEMKGHTVTNTLAGNYKLLKGNKIKIISLEGTEVNEPSWGNKFWEAIRTASSYNRNNNTLFILFNAGKAKIEFKKVTGTNTSTN